MAILMFFVIGKFRDKQPSRPLCSQDRNGRDRERLTDLCYNRSDAAYNRAAKGAGNADGYRVVTTGANGLSVASSI